MQVGAVDAASVNGSVRRAVDAPDHEGTSAAGRDDADQARRRQRRQLVVDDQLRSVHDRVFLAEVAEEVRLLELSVLADDRERRAAGDREHLERELAVAGALGRDACGEVRRAKVAVRRRVVAGTADVLERGGRAELGRRRAERNAEEQPLGRWRLRHEAVGGPRVPGDRALRPGVVGEEDRVVVRVAVERESGPARQPQCRAGDRGARRDPGEVEAEQAVRPGRCRSRRTRRRRGRRTRSPCRARRWGRRRAHTCPIRGST